MATRGRAGARTLAPGSRPRLHQPAWGLVAEKEGAVAQEGEVRKVVDKE